MKTRKAKLIGFLSIMAVLISVLALGNLMARPSSQTAGSVTISGGALAGTFFSDKPGFNVVTVRVADADLSPQRVGSARFTGLSAGTSVFNLTSAAAIIGGEKEKTQKFTGDGFSKVFPLTTVALTAANIVNFNAPFNAATLGGVSVLALGRTAIDRNSADGLTKADVHTGASASTVDAVLARASSTTTTTADSVSIVSLTIATSDVSATGVVTGGSTTFNLTKKPADLDGDFRFTHTGDIVSVTLTAGGNPVPGFALTNSFPGIGTGGQVRFGALPLCGAAACNYRLIITYRRYDPVSVAQTTLTMASALTTSEANAAWGPNKLPRDSGIGLATPAKDGAYTGDDFVLVVNNVTVPVGSYTFDFPSKLVTITTGPTPNPAVNSVSITYQYSEYDVTAPANTPITFAGTTVKVGTTLATATSAKTIDTVNNTTGTIALGSTIGAGNTAAVIIFRYDVRESVVKIAKVSTPTSDVQNKSRELTGVESSATSNSFSFKVALFTLADLTAIETAAAKAGVTTIALLTADAGIGAALDTKINAAAVGLGLSGRSTDGSLLALIMPVADGETLTATYKDADPASTKTDVAVIDLTAPRITRIRPAVAFTNSLAHVFEVEVEDAPGGVASAAGMAIADIDILVTQFENDSSVVNAVVPIQQAAPTNTFRLNHAQVFFLVGKVRFWVTVQDRVGNIPVFAGLNAVEGAGDPANPATRPRSPFSFTIDNVPPTLAPVDPVKSGGKLDDRLETSPTGTHTALFFSDTVLTDFAANFITAGVAVGDMVDNLTDKSSGTITARTATTVTVGSLTAGTDNQWQNGDAYKISNPGLGNVIDSATTRNNVRVNFDLGVGGAGLDTVNPLGTDFSLKIGATPLTITKAEIGANGAGVLLTLANELPTDATPSFEIVSTATTDEAGNIVAKTTGAVTAVDGLAPVLAVTVAGDASSRPVSRQQVTISVAASEAVNFPPGLSTARYLREAPDGTLEEAANFASQNLTFSSTGPNTFEATVQIGDLTPVKALQSGVVNIQITAHDANFNQDMVGLRDPDGTNPADRAIIRPGAIVFEFDNELNDSAAPVFSLSPVAPGRPTETSPNPSVTIDFTGESDEYRGTGLRILSFDVDTHDSVTVTKAILNFPDGSTGDVTADTTRLDDDSWVLMATGLPTGDYSLAVQARDAVGNTDLTPGGSAVDELTFNFRVVSGPILGVIQGRVLLQGRGSSLGAFVTTVAGQVHFADAGGNYSIELVVGTFDITLKAPGYLPVTITGVDLSSGLAVMPPITLAYGDSNGDGAIDVRDLSTQAANLGKTGTTIPAP